MFENKAINETKNFEANFFFILFINRAFIIILVLLNFYENRGLSWFQNCTNYTRLYEHIYTMKKKIEKLIVVIIFHKIIQ